MERTEKAAVISGLKEEWRDVQSMVLVNYSGIDVPTVTTIRDAFRQGGCNYRVLKNTLVKIAIQGSRVEPLSVLLKGPIAVVWSNDSPSAPAKVATKLAKDNDKFKIRGGYFDGQLLDVAGVETLATMPGMDELRASLLMTFLAAPTDMVRTLAAGPINFMYVMQARERSLGDS